MRIKKKEKKNKKKKQGLPKLSTNGRPTRTRMLN